MKRELKGNLASILMSFIMGFQYVFVKNVIEIAQNQFFFVLFIRFFIAFLICLFVFNKETKESVKKIKTNKEIISLSFFHPFLNYTFQIIGVFLCPVLLVSVLIAFIPVINSVFSVVCLKERINKKQIVLLILSTLSALMIAFSKEFEFKKGIFFGIVFILISIISRGAFSVKAKKLLSEMSAGEITYIQIFLGLILFLVCFVVSLFFYSGVYYMKILLNNNFIFGILYLSILSTVVVFYSNNISLKYLTVSNTGLLNSITSVVSAFAGVFFLKERMNLAYITGLVVIIFCVVFYNHSFTK